MIAAMLFVAFFAMPFFAAFDAARAPLMLPPCRCFHFDAFADVSP